MPEIGRTFVEKRLHAFARVVAGKATVKLAALEQNPFGKRSLKSTIHLELVVDARCIVSGGSQLAANFGTSASDND